MRRAALLLVVFVAAGCTTGTTPVPVGSGASTVTGTFGPSDTGAISYDPTLVPPGAAATVTIAPTSAGIEIHLAVSGLRPNRTYGAHLHVHPCGAAAIAAGPHYQHNKDPQASATAPSVDPSYANPRNEVWLDFTTDANGGASSTSTQQWTFDSGARPRSLVIHAEGTQTMAGHAGDAGARVACLTLPA
jgi:superoxide dismutase, Cu-Zn family